MGSRTLATIAWLASIAISAGVAMRAPAWVRPRPSDAIALLLAHKGKVQSREDGIALWLDARDGDKFADGTLIATDSKGSARVKFADGRLIELGSKSQIVLRKDEDESEDMTVTLLKGTLQAPPKVVAETTTVPARRLVIKAGTKRVALATHNDAVAVAKSAQEVAPKLTMLSGTPLVAPFVPPPRPQPPELPVARVVIRDLPQIAPPSVPAVAATNLAPPVDDVRSRVSPQLQSPQPLPTEPVRETASVPSPTSVPAAAVPTPKPPVVAALDRPKTDAVLWPEVIWPPAQSTLWTFGSPGGPLPPMAVKLRYGVAPRQGGAANAIQLTGSSGTVLALTDLAGKGKEGIVEGTFDALRLPPAANSLAVSLRPLIKSDGAKKAEFGDPAARSFRIASLPTKGPVTITVKEFHPKKTAAQSVPTWLTQREEVTPSNAAVTVALQNGEDLKALLPLLSGSPSFAILATPAASASTPVTVVRDGAPVAAVGTLLPSAVRWTRLALAGDLAFRGAKDAYLGDGSRARQVLGAATPPVAATLHVYDSSWFPAALHAGLFKRYPSALALLAHSAKAVFSKPVDLLDPQAQNPTPSHHGTWLATHKSKIQRRGLSLPLRVTFVTGAHGENMPTFRLVDAVQLASVGPYTAIDARDADFAVRLNPTDEEIEGDGHAALIRRAQTLAAADIVVFCPPGEKTWRVERASGGDVRTIGSAAAMTASASARDLGLWLNHALGLENRVLAQDDDQLMTMRPPGFTKGRQGLVVVDSGSVKQVPIAVVESKEVDGPFVATQKLLGRGNEIPIGATILWE